MDDFTYQLNEMPESEAVQQWRNDFGNDEDRVLFGPDLLHSMNCAPIQDTHSTFLNPISDMLSADINFCEQIGFEATHSMQPPSISAPPLNSWGVQEHLDPSNISSFINLTDQLKSAEVSDATANYSSQPIVSECSVLLPADANVEFPAVDCSFLGNDYSSSISQWLQSIEQQQYLTQQQQSHAPQPVAPTQTQCYSDTLINSIGSLPASTTITPVALNNQQNCARYTHTPSFTEHDINLQIGSNFVANNCTEVFPAPAKAAMLFTKEEKRDIPAPSYEYHNHNVEPQVVAHAVPAKRKCAPNAEQTEWKPILNSTQSITQQITLPIHTKEMYTKSLETFTNNANFQPTALIPFSTRQTTDVTNQKKHVNLNPILPRKPIMQPPEMIVMHPLRTRKVLTNHRSTVSSSEKSNAVINLSEYFDTSCINIPMIKERNRAEPKSENRRKQKLHIIPGAENLVFEVQKESSQEVEAISTISNVNDNTLDELDPYPETELPELDEIFKRKKKTIPTNNVASKKLTLSSACSAIVLENFQKKIEEPLSAQQQTSSATFEENVSAPAIVNPKPRRNLSIDKQDILYNSDSDSIESVIEKIDQNSNGGKSFKCLKCRKYFKSTRSLAIHSKRCASTKSDSTSSCSEMHEENSNLYKNKQSSQQVVIKLARIHQDDLIENIESENSEDTEVSSLPSRHTTKARPLTRSQTRRSNTPSNLKRFK